MDSKRPSLSFKKIALLLFVILQLSSCLYVGFQRRPSNAKIGNQLRSEKKYDEAIQAYEKHITARLEDSRREQDENPYFYLIVIGDIYLEQENTAKALESYLSARDKEVEIDLVADRIRRVAKLLRKNGQAKEALTLVKKYRVFDEFVFDLDTDEILKEIVQSEDKSSKEKTLKKSKKN